MEKKPEKKTDFSKFEISVNQFGEIVQTIKTEDIVEFLNENTEDLKLNDHPDFKKNEE